MSQHSAGLSELVRVYEAHLRGHAVGIPAAPPDSAPLIVGLLLDTTGWRPDGWSRARRFLRGVLEAFVADGVFKPRNGASRVVVAESVALMWGVNAHPCSAPAAARRIGLKTGHSTLKEWPAQVLRCPSVRTYVAEQGQRGDVLVAVPAGCNERSAWNHRATREWPPTRWGTGRGTAAVDEFAALADAVSARFPITMSDGTQLPDLATLGQSIPTDVVLPIALLRELVGRHLSQWFAEAEQSEHLIWVRNNVFEPWFRDDALAMLVPQTSATDGTRSRHRYGPSVAAATQMLMWDTVADRAALAEVAHTRLLATSRLADLATVIDTGLGIGRSVQALSTDARARLGLRSQQGLDRLVTTAHVDAATLAATDGYFVAPRDFVSMLDTAGRIRKAADPTIKSVLVEEYLRVRPAAVHAARTDAAHGEIALADQSIHWDTVTMEAITLSERMAAAVRCLPARGKWGYLSHTYRCLAVCANKHDRWGVAFAQIVEGLDALAQLVAWNYVVDPREQEESAHQLYLAGAGVAVRRLERALQQFPAGHSETVTSLARAALWFSHAALASLAFLETTQLHAVRHVDGYIATTGWRAQSRIIRLRVLLAVRTAVQAGLTSEQDILATSQPDMPLHALVPDQDGAELVCGAGVQGIVVLYRELQHITELSSVHTSAVVPLAAWLAFLNGGLLPVEDNPAAGVVAASEVLCRREHQLGHDHIPLDVTELVLWLAHRQTDALALSWIPVRSVAGRALDHQSNGIFRRFRDLHDVFRGVPSHD